ncbi:hypothetical protein [Micromonospora sp. WMMD980]|uniref:hypothetical protein n=1 Tax=Micromonospora sp. WMMD980 TaxID=3016088 RepID=UPI002415973B|nr:hypothetical protein [Micromonospora sp. WMMD980]MDG4803759.1 hypothetical protein [Micromonospora sp. WMMD980]
MTETRQESAVQRAAEPLEGGAGGRRGGGAIWGSRPGRLGGAGDARRRVQDELDGDGPADLSLCGTLLVEAALAAARCADVRGALELVSEADGGGRRLAVVARRASCRPTGRRQPRRPRYAIDLSPATWQADRLGNRTSRRPWSGSPAPWCRRGLTPSDVIATCIVDVVSGGPAMVAVPDAARTASKRRVTRIAFSSLR